MDRSTAMDRSFELGHTKRQRLTPQECSESVYHDESNLTSQVIKGRITWQDPTNQRQAKGKSVRYHPL
jgi:hypothetical protein